MKGPLAFAMAVGSILRSPHQILVSRPLGTTATAVLALPERRGDSRDSTWKGSARRQCAPPHTDSDRHPVMDSDVRYIDSLSKLVMNGDRLEAALCERVKECSANGTVRFVACPEHVTRKCLHRRANARAAQQHVYPMNRYQ